jgi:hypothetical protein
MVDNFFSGIPNEDKVPHIHAITSRNMAILQSPDLLNYCQVDKNTLNTVYGQTDELADSTSVNFLQNLTQELFDCSQKLIAIFKLILKNDVVASNYLLYNLLSKVHQRSPENIPIGQFNINVSNLKKNQAA